ncbi:MAG: MarR family winged helix-turn-helix transcriptional regulator [Crocinitomicaceae bacterium]
MSKDVPELFLENQLCFPLYAASRLTTKIYAPLLDELGITYPQYIVLMVLWENGRQSVKEIGKQLYLESNTLTPLLKRMEQKELIQRNRSAEDERTVIVSLTSNGRKLKERATQIPGKLQECFNDQSMKEEELIQFQKTLFKLVHSISEKAG